MLKTEKDVRIAGALAGFGLIWALAFMTGAFTVDTKRDELFWTVTAMAMAGAGWWLAPMLHAALAGVAQGEEIAAATAAAGKALTTAIDKGGDVISAPLMAMVDVARSQKVLQGPDMTVSLRADYTALHFSQQMADASLDAHVYQLLQRSDLEGNPRAAHILLAVYTVANENKRRLVPEFMTAWEKVTGITLPTGERFFGGSSSASRP